MKYVPRLVLVVGCVAALAPAALRAQPLNNRVENIIAGSKIGQATVGVSIVDIASNRTLAEVRADQPLIPASNQKVLTTGTALLVLGPDFVFKTELILDGDRLIIRGSGDPALADPALLDRMNPKMTVETMISALAGAVARSGITSISEVIADDRIFDRTLIHESWPKDQLERWYCAPVSGINFHTNVVSVFPSPSPDGIGRPPVVSIEPIAPWLSIENKARTVAQGKNAVWLARSAETQRYTMYGEVRFPSVTPIEVTVFDPAVLMAQLLAAELPRNGVAVGVGPGAVAPVASERRLSAAQTEQVIGAARTATAEERLEGRTVAVVTTHITDILQRCNNDSQNLYAEALLKRIGREVTGEAGSWTNGSSIIRMTLAQERDMGPRYAATTVVADGSGMSRDDRVAPRTLTRWLARIEREPRFGELFIDSLATPGDGTLRRRFHDAHLANNLHAKSGKIDGVRCLSGFLTDPATRQRVAFSIMVNDLKEGENALQSLKLHEEIVVAIDQWLTAQRPKPAAPRTAAAPSSTVTRTAR